MLQQTVRSNDMNDRSQARAEQSHATVSRDGRERVSVAGSDSIFSRSSGTSLGDIGRQKKYTESVPDAERSKNLHIAKKCVSLSCCLHRTS